MNTPRLSVTVLNYNYGHFLPTCLDSLLNQSFTDFEVILINDCSTDNSLAIIEPFLADQRVRLVNHEHNKGFVQSLIEGAALSQGSYLTVLSADDWIVDQNAFAKQIDILEESADIAFVYSAYGHYNDEQHCESEWHGANTSYVLDGREAFRHLVVNPFMLHSGTIIRKTAYVAVGGYNASTAYLVDTRMWLSLCHVGKIAYIDEALYAYRRHGTNMSRSAVALHHEIAEILSTIAWTFKHHPQGHTKEFQRLRAKAEHRALIAFAVDDVYRGHYRHGWRSFRIAMCIRPIQTIFQWGTALMLARTLFGRKGFTLVRQFSLSNRPRPKRVYSRR